MNILIIGGAGFLGANLVRYCLREPNHRITVLDSLESRLNANTNNLRDVWSRIRFIRGSMGDDHLIAEAIQGQNVIYNCAAQTSHPLSLQDPLFDAEVNCLGNLKLLEAVRLLNPEARVLYTSSSTVIGKAVNDIIDEMHWEKPLDIYSANKGVAEKYDRIYSRVYDLHTVILRFANLYGPYGKGFPEFGFVNYFIHLAWAGQEIKVFGSGEQTRNVMYVEDAVKIICHAAQDERLKGEMFFAVHDEHYSVLDIAKTIVKIFGRGTVTHIDWPEDRRRIEIDRVKISASRLRSITGWLPSCSLEQGLKKMREFLESQEGK